VPPRAMRQLVRPSYPLERCTNTWRHRVARLVRAAWSCAKPRATHRGALQRCRGHDHRTRATAESEHYMGSTTLAFGVSGRILACFVSSIKPPVTRIIPQYHTLTYGTARDTIHRREGDDVPTIDEVLQRLTRARANFQFRTLVAFCTLFFGEPRIRGSHHIFTMPWAGDPRINLQEDGNQAKPCQVQQVIRALKKLKEQGP
jgi:hypothetical protein